MMLASLIGAGGFWLPRQGSTTAARVDFLFHAITNIAIFFFILIAALLVYFVWKYRARPGHRPVAPSPRASRDGMTSRRRDPARVGDAW